VTARDLIPCAALVLCFVLAGLAETHFGGVL